jgi:hypothetical protein
MVCTGLFLALLSAVNTGTILRPKIENDLLLRIREFKMEIYVY